MNKEEKVKNEIPQGSQGKSYQEVAFFATWSFRFQGSEAILLSLLNYQFKTKMKIVSPHPPLQNISPKSRESWTNSTSKKVLTTRVYSNTIESKRKGKKRNSKEFENTYNCETIDPSPGAESFPTMTNNASILVYKFWTQEPKSKNQEPRIKKKKREKEMFRKVFSFTIVILLQMTRIDSII